MSLRPGARVGGLVSSGTQRTASAWRPGHAGCIALWALIEWLATARLRSGVASLHTLEEGAHALIARPRVVGRWSVQENPMTNDAVAVEPWKWPEQQWRALVNHVRAGRTLRPAEWPGGARCAVALSFDSDHETNELRDGGTSIGRLCWGQYGNRVGVPRILALLARYDVPATFYVPAV